MYFISMLWTDQNYQNLYGKDNIKNTILKLKLSCTEKMQTRLPVLRSCAWDRESFNQKLKLRKNFVTPNKNLATFKEETFVSYTFDESN